MCLSQSVLFADKIIFLITILKKFKMQSLKRTKQFITLSILGLFLISCNEAPKAPVADKKPFAMVQFGDTRVDPYYWLNQRDSANVLSYLNAERVHTRKPQ